MTQVIGLTGGIATGKSTVSNYLASQGYQIIDADEITKKVQSKGSNGLKSITTFFGNDILYNNGELNRKKLGSIVFQDKRKLRVLVRLIDPYIRSEIINEINTTKQKIVILDAPTLFENGYYYLCDEIITIECSQEHQVQRLMDRDGLTQKGALDRIDSQWPLSIKKKLSDKIINSDGSIEQTRAQVMKIFNN